jgi:hypothetical protein
MMKFGVYSVGDNEPPAEGDLRVDPRFASWGIVIDGKMKYLGVYADFLIGSQNRLYIVNRN